MKIKKFYPLLLIFLFVAGCNYPGPAAPTPFPTLVIPTITPPPAITELPPTQNVILPSPTSAPPTIELTTAPTSTPTATATISPTKSPTAQPSATPHGDGACTFQAAYVSDVSIPDNTQIGPGISFVKTWRIRNEGTCTWGPDGYALNQLVYVGGDRMGGSTSVALPDDVSQGGTLDISVNLTAPTTPGSYTGYWMLALSDGTRIGFGPEGDQPLTVVIKVPTNTASGATRVQFTEGGTSAAESGSLNANQSGKYVVNALKDQLMLLTLSSSSDQTKMSLIGSDGKTPTLLANSPNTTINARLPSSQDYIVTVTSGSQAANYSLNIIVPARIRFDPGAISDTLSGEISNHIMNTYVLGASKGQTMTVSLTPSDGTLGLTIYGLSDGQPLVRAEGGATSFNGTLPATQDYILQIVPGVNSASYTLKVTIK